MRGWLATFLFPPIPISSFPFHDASVLISISIPLPKYITISLLSHSRQTNERHLSLNKNNQFLNINISHGSVVTHLRCGKMFHNDLIENLPLSLAVKEL